MKLTIETCASALNAAAMNRRAAIQLELAVGLAVFLLHGSSSKEARTMLVGAYVAAGYQCAHISEMDYKTVNRRINATAALFEKVPVAKWVGKHNEVDAIRAICEGLGPYELYTIQDVMRYAAPQKVKAKTAVKPHADLLHVPTGQANNHTGQQKIADQMRRASDRIKGGLTLSTEHLSLLVPKDTPRAEIIELAMQLLALAKKDAKELLTA